MDQRIWLITGISSGLGKELAQAVMSSGDFVIGTFRKQDQVDQFNNTYEGKGKGILLHVNDMEQVSNQVSQCLQEFGKIDVLVNNAGAGFVGAVEEASIDEVRQVFETNFYGTLQLVQKLLPSMRQNKSGHIIQISSQAGIKANAGFGIYNASKFALEGYSEALAQEVAPLGLKVSIVEPGPFRTEFAGTSLNEAAQVIEDYEGTATAFRNRIKSISGKQEGNPTKAAHAIIELANSSEPTLRLPLGSIAVKTFEAKIESLQQDLEANRQTAENAIYHD